MKQVSNKKPVVKAPVCRSNPRTERIQSDVFAASAKLATQIAGAQSAVIVCTKPDNSGSILAKHGKLGLCPDDLLQWVAHLPLDVSHAVSSDEVSKAPTNPDWIWQISTSAHGRSFHLLLFSAEPLEISHEDEALLKTTVEQVGDIYLLKGTEDDGDTNHYESVRLSSASAMLDAILDHVPDRIFIKDTNGAILNCTHAFAVAHGVESKETLIGSTVWDLYPTRQAETYFDEEKQILVGGSPILNRVQKSLDLHGQDSWLSVTKVPIYTKHGSITGIIGIARDISQIKQSEIEIATARDAALDSARAKSSFLANMSHELRTPLNGIIGMGTLLNASPLTQDQRDIVDTVHTSAEDLLDIINEVLSFSRGESGKMTLEQSEFHPNEVLDGVLDLFGEQALSKGVELVANPLPPNSPTLTGDPGKFRQVLVNLAGNAIKFTDTGAVEIEINELCQNSESMFSFEVVVRDSGIGLTTNSIKELFDPFTQADESASRRFGGTGLGLAISKQIIELMGGKIGARGTTPRGSEFWFRLELPLATSPTVLNNDPRARTTRQILSLHTGSESAKNLRTLLEQMGHDVECTQLPSQAKQILESERSDSCWDIIMLYSKFGGLSWTSFLNDLDARTLNGLPPTILLTEYGEPIAPSTLSRFQIASTLTKPIKQDRLIGCIDDALHAKDFTSLPKPAATEDTAIYRRRHGLGSQRVLVVEENTSNQKILIQLLDRLGFRADPVGSGKEAIDSLRRIYYPVILVSCIMSGMDGHQTTRKIRELENQQFREKSTAISQIVGMSGHLTDLALDACTDSGMNDCICVPVIKDDLKIAMADAVSRLRYSSNVPITKTLGTRHSRNMVS